MSDYPAGKTYEGSHWMMRDPYQWDFSWFQAFSKLELSTKTNIS